MNDESIIQSAGWAAASPPLIDDCYDASTNMGFWDFGFCKASLELYQDLPSN